MLFRSESGRTFDAIVSDIEMPEMNGLQFADKVRSDPKWKDTPLVAVSSKAEPSDVDRGLQAGFDAYVPKTERARLMSTLESLIQNDNKKAA